MRLSLDWLRDYVKVTSTPEALAEALVMTTAEVEETISAPLPLKEAVVGTITAIKPHPNADRLRLATVRVGKQSHTVVCGAPNIAVDQRVPFITAGKHYHTDKGESVLESATIRGVASAGMLASASDLGFGSDHEGIMILPNTAREGTSVAAVVGWELPTLDLEITPNRSDLLSYLGLAREVAAIEKNRVTMPPILSMPSHHSKSIATVSVETALCSRYTATVVTGITNTASPLWMQARLLAHDIKPQNAVVDITNYVMLELGQPLHAFDATTLREYGELCLSVRTAFNGETFTALDNKEYELSREDIVIDAGGQSIALAGVIGGRDSAVSATTTEIVLESAVFDAVAVRKTATRHSCRTDAVTRFEKGVDPEMTVVAVKRVLKLLHEICGGTVQGGMSDANYQHSTKQQINVSLERAKRVLGVTFSPTQAKTLLTKIGFGATQTGKHELSVLVPSWRNDSEIEEDIFEELIRLGGYDQIEPTLPSGPLCTSVKPVVYTTLSKIRHWMARNQLRELESQAFATAEHIATYHVNGGKPVQIANPTTNKEAYYRFSLLPHMIERALAQSRTTATLASFEIGNIATHSKERIDEHTHLAICMLTSDPVTTAQQVKGILETVPAAAQRSGGITFGNAKSVWPFLVKHPDEIRYSGKVVGQIGVITDAITRQGKLRGDRYLVVAEVTLTPILAAKTAIFRYQSPHKYPVVTRDITVTLAPDSTARDVLAAANPVPEIVKNITVADYHQTAAGPNVTFRITLYDDRTLTDSEVADAVQHITKILKKHSS